MGEKRLKGNIPLFLRVMSLRGRIVVDFSKSSTMTVYLQSEYQHTLVGRGNWLRAVKRYKPPVIR